MSTALIVGGDQIDGIRKVLTSYGMTKINHWSGRKAGDGKKVIPTDTELIVLVTDWINHNFTHKIKQTAARRGVRIIYTTNGPAALRTSLARFQDSANVSAEPACRKTTSTQSCLMRWLTQLITAKDQIFKPRI